MRSLKVIATLTVLAIGHGSASAQYRCDCTSIVDTCTANVVAHGSWLEIKSDRPQCSRVDYFVDGQPLVSVVVDGEDREDWLARTASPKIIVQSCQVCRDNGAGAANGPPITLAPAPAKTNGEESSRLQPLIAGVPEYPAAAAARGVRGHVDVEFTVTPAGTVENAHVTASEPSRIFDSAALAAVARWRYPAQPDRAPQVLTERIDFRPAPAAAARTPAPTAAEPRNQCVREDAVYNYGEVVDVSLINACSEPLLVFDCALGTGKSLGRWVCSSSEERGEVLVQSSSERVGSRYTAGDASTVRTYTYTSGYSVTRAPNSEHWWVACTEADMNCRIEARQWLRAVNAQPASIDPGDRSPIAVARSY